MTTLTYYLLFIFTWMISRIPFWFIYRISDVLFWITFYIIRYRKSTVYKNLQTSFPGKTPEEIDILAKAFYRHFCDFILEAIKGMSISKAGINKRMKYANLDILTELAGHHQSFALVSAHYNNWEWLNNMPAKMMHEFMVIYRPLKNKNINRLVNYIRSRLNANLIPMDNIYREAFKRKSGNELFCIWFLADQRPQGSTKFWTMFLNHEAAFFEGVEKISKKLELAVVFMDIQKVSRGHYETTFKKIFDNGALTKENEITLACIKEIENAISKRPEYWLWSHKRFKHKRPENIKLIDR